MPNADSQEKQGLESSHTHNDSPLESTLTPIRLNQLLRSTTRLAFTPDASLLDVLDHTVESLYHAHKYSAISIYLMKLGNLQRQASAGDGYDIAAYIIESAIQTQTTFFCGSIEYKANAEDDVIYAEACIPILQRNRVIGLLDVQAKGANRFGRDDVNLLEIVADHIAILMENIDLYDSLESIQGSLEVELIWREAAQAKLEKSEKQLKGIIQSASDAIVSIDHHQNIVLVNHSVEKMFGYTADELIDRPLTMLMPAEFKGRHRSHVANFGKTGTSTREMGLHSELVGQRSDGTVFPIEAMISQIVINGEQIFTAIVRDISERVSAALAIQQERDLVLKIMDTVAEGIVVHDASGEIIMCNTGATTILALSKEQLMGITSFDPSWHTIYEDGRPFPPEEHPAVMTLQTGKAFSKVPMGVYKASDGITWITINTRPLFLEGESKPHSVVVSFSDVTHLKQMAASLQHSEDRFRRLTEYSPDIILIIDVSTREILYVNHEQFWKPDELGFLHSDDLLDWISFNDRVDVSRSWLSLVQGEISITEPISCKLQEKIDTWEWVQIRSTALSRNKDGMPMQIMSVITNITELKNIELAMQQMQKLESLGLMASGIAHDFNNILTALNANADLALLHLTNEDSRAIEQIKQSQSTLERGALLTKQLLDYAGKGDRGGLTAEIDRAVAQTIQMLHFSVPKNISVHTDLDTRGLSVAIGEAQLQQIIMNLLLNAAEAYDGTPGAIGVTTSRTQITEHNIGLFKDSVRLGDYLHMSVSDFAGGIDDATYQQMFDPFFTTKEAGHGLGLATVVGVVISHHGDLRVSSVLGEGARFDVYLPIQDGPQEAVKRPTLVSPPAEQTLSIMVVDDQMAIRKSISEYLRMSGYEAIEAHNGAEALQLLEDQTEMIDLIVLDISMPVMSGTELLGRMQQTDLQTPIILLSGYNEIDVDDQLRGNVAAYLKKPFNLKELIETIEGSVANNFPPR